MPNTAVAQGTATPNRAVFLLTGDGTVVGPTITNAEIQAAMVAGPLLDLWSASYADQAAMRLALLVNNARATVLLRATGVDVTAQVNQIVADVDTDAVTPTTAEINIGMSNTIGQVAYLILEHVHSIGR